MVLTLIGVAQYENPLIDVHSAELIRRLAQVQRRAPPFFYAIRHRRSLTVAHINTADDVVGPRLLESVRAVMANHASA